MTTPLSRRVLTRATAALAAAAVTALGAGAAAASGATAGAAASPSFSFALKLSSPAIAKCMPHASGRVTITGNAQNDVMKISLHGVAPNTTFATFILQEPRKPFGLAWYQTDVDTDGRGNGNATVQGIFNRETFSVSVGGPTATFAPTHLFHVGLWFDDVDLPFERGCEPGATTPVITQCR